MKNPFSFQMSLCTTHGRAFVLYCEQCGEFLCEQCVDSEAHASHRVCTAQKAERLLREEGETCVKQLRDMCSTMRAAYTQQDAGETTGYIREEAEWLAVFGEVERAMAAIKEEFMARCWAQKANSEGSRRMEIQGEKFIKFSISKILA